MVKYTCKTPTALVYGITAVREALPKRMPGVVCTGQSSEPRRMPRLCSMGFNSPLSRVRIPPCVVKRIASGLVCPSGRESRTRKPLPCARTIRIRHHEATSEKHSLPVRATQRRLCLRADTVFSQTAPKDLFPRRDGDTQALSRRFCGNGDEAKCH